ncbi:sugar transferase [Ilumatobacter sp.]|uniref:sugar transferase n=1 Tax=Ilumatobacter sp. TaxID=1967498 RepID=UPI003753A7EE
MSSFAKTLQTDTYLDVQPVLLRLVTTQPTLDLPSVTVTSRRISRADAIRKRLFDLAIAIPAAVFTLPIVLALAVGSAISFRAWPFFTQIRLGHHGEEFRFMKVRSLPATAPAAADKYELETVQNTRFGNFLRKSHLDELPQLWLVVWGTMSLVGPRPEMPSLAATFDSDFVAARLTVKPGCTGLWQISKASAGLIGENPEYDLLYVDSESIRLDLWVLIRTAREILGGASMTSIKDVPGWAIQGETAAGLLDAA